MNIACGVYDSLGCDTGPTLSKTNSCLRTGYDAQNACEDTAAQDADEIGSTTMSSGVFLDYGQPNLGFRYCLR